MLFLYGYLWAEEVAEFRDADIKYSLTNMTGLWVSRQRGPFG